MIIFLTENNRSRGSQGRWQKLLASNYGMLHYASMIRGPDTKNRWYAAAEDTKTRAELNFFAEKLRAGEIVTIVRHDSVVAQVHPIDLEERIAVSKFDRSGSFVFASLLGRFPHRELSRIKKHPGGLPFVVREVVVGVTRPCQSEIQGDLQGCYDRLRRETLVAALSARRSGQGKFAITDLRWERCRRELTARMSKGQHTVLYFKDEDVAQIVELENVTTAKSVGATFIGAYPDRVLNKLRSSGKVHPLRFKGESLLGIRAL